MRLRIFVPMMFLVSPLMAAPPSVSALTPSGGERGKRFSVVASGSFEKWPVEVWSDTKGVTAKAEKEKGKFTFTLAQDAPLGAAWLRFSDDTGASGLRPFIVGGLTESNEIEPNDDTKTTMAITLPSVVNGVLAKAGDVDCFTVKLIKGQTLVASLEAHRTLRSPIDAVLQILLASGEILDQNHDARSLDPQLVLTAPADGTYIVRLFAFPSQPDSSIRHFGSPTSVYRLTLTAGEFIDFAMPLAVQKDRQTTLTLQGWNLKSSTGELGKTEGMIGIANPFAIARELHPCFDRTEESDKPLSPPFTATGRVSKAGVPPKIRVSGTPKEPLTIRLDSATLGLSLTPVLKLKDAGGKLLLNAEPAEGSGAIEVNFTPPTDGIFSIDVHDLFKSGGPRHAYRLRVVAATPDVDAKLESDRFTLTVGTPLDISLAVARKHGFSGELIPFAEGLPEGVTASLAPSIDKPDPKKVTLRLTATKAGFGGNIRMGVTKKGDDTFRRLAKAPLAEFDRDTADISLTVKKN